MKIRARIFLGFSVILTVTAFVLISWILNNVNIQPKKAMEESLVDTAQILAAFIQQKLQGPVIDPTELGSLLKIVNRRKFSARIYELVKTSTNIRVYVTNKKGRVIFDSQNNEWLGEDFSRWHDVLKTMSGGYGARTTRADPQDPTSSVAYVGAPIYYQGDIIGVCTAAKPWKSIHSFVESTRKNFLIAVISGFILILILSYIISFWITKPILKLTEYAHTVKYGIRTDLPNVGQGEIKVLADAFEGMRESLEGRKYIENYVQSLTHQLKGPLSSIRGAAELLQEDLPEEDRSRFIKNIELENRRIQKIIDRLLELASIEKKKRLQNIEKVNIRDLVSEVAETLEPLFNRRKITWVNTIPATLFCPGERFLLRQALLNLIQNATDFTGQDGKIEASAEKKEGYILISIRDNGCGIPDYAVPKIYDRFYSLQRPEGGPKSSGLGLSLVREVADLHHGKIFLENNPDQGVTATLRLPTA